MAVFIFSPQLGAVLRVVDTDSAADMAKAVGRLAASGLPRLINIGMESAIVVNFSRCAAVRFTIEPPRTELPVVSVHSSSL
ncbi:hypothetical protein [Actinokineospora diospyrosa]|uniref:hypothetical protein n=1 Tax=Actinokineospora diospyrosa TaxID=103728 RepID=UPI0020A5A8FB|nr:hypothetical protein [Actinokineospora diospyrosa]